MSQVSPSSPQVTSPQVALQASSQKKASPKANKRAWVGINLTGILIGMTVTGVMSYFLAYSETVAGIHTWFGLSFIVLIGFHLRNNLRTLLNYIRQHHGRRFVIVSTSIALILVISVSLSLPPFSSLLEFGREIRKSVSIEEGSYQMITTRLGDTGLPIAIELRKGKHYESPAQPLFLGLTYTSIPQVAYWIEDLNGQYIDTLYVTKKTSNGSFVPTEDIFSQVSRPEALPYWAHQRGIKYDDLLMSPSPNNTDLDGMTGPTPLGNYDIRSSIETELRQFKVMMEINRSYDFNAFYHQDKYPDDPIYSGSGSSGQPSVIYAVEVNLDDNQHTYLMQPIGHGHYSGANGTLYADMQGIDSALELVQRVIVDI